MRVQDLQLEDQQATNVLNTITWHKEIIDPLLNACTPPELLVIASYFLSNLCVNYPQMYAQFVRIFTFMELLSRNSSVFGVSPKNEKGLINWFVHAPLEPLTERPDLICLFETRPSVPEQKELPTVLM